MSVDTIVLFALLILVSLSPLGLWLLPPSKTIDADEYWRRRELRSDDLLESIKATENYAQAAIKSAILLNGASATALVALFSKASDIEPAIMLALKLFILGTLAAGLATGFAYFFASAANRAIWKWIEANIEASNRLFRATTIFEFVSIGLVVASYCLFCAGAFSGVGALTTR